MNKMKILFLGYSEDETRLISFLTSLGHEVKCSSDRIDCLIEYDLVISFGYKYILSEQVLRTANRKPINLHISFLPFNRGMHPNFWAHYDETPSGITIHHIDEGIDTGEIIFQRQIEFYSYETTFRQTWERLKEEIEVLFMDEFDRLKKGEYQIKKQELQGSFHHKSDLPKDFLGWDCEITAEIARLKRIKF